MAEACSSKNWRRHDPGHWKAQTIRVDVDTLAARIRQELLGRSEVLESFFKAEAPRLAEARHEISRRFLAGGRSSAFGVL